MRVVSSPQKTQNSFGEKEEVVEEKDLEKAIFAHLPFSSLCSSTRGEAVLKWGRENAARVCAYTTAKEGGIGSYFRSHFLPPSGGGIEEMEKSLRRSRILLPFLGGGGENKGFRSLFSSAHSFPLFLFGGKEYRILSSFFPGRFSRRFEGRPDAAKYVFRSEYSKAAKKRRPRPIPPPPTPWGGKLTAQTNPTSIQGSSRIICHFFPPAKASSW